MALGGGTYLSQNKILPGTYFQFVSKAMATATISDRGVAGMALELDWGQDGKIMEVTAEEFYKKSRQPFQFIVTRKLPNGKMLFDTNMKVSLENYSITEESKNGFDVTLSIFKNFHKFYRNICGIIFVKFINFIFGFTNTLSKPFSYRKINHIFSSSPICI